MIDSKIVDYNFQQFLKFGALAGFIAISVLLINVNFVAFKKIFREKTFTYWWLFLVFTLVPLALMLYVFSYLFER